MEMKKLLGYPESITVAKTAFIVTSEVVPEAFLFEDNGRQPPSLPSVTFNTDSVAKWR